MSDLLETVGTEDSAQDVPQLAPNDERWDLWGSMLGSEGEGREL